MEANAVMLFEARQPSIGCTKCIGLKSGSVVHLPIDSFAFSARADPVT